MERKKINIGFDIGITSVGWSIVDEENKIISRGVRTFEEVKSPKDGKLANENRRDKRHLRRTIRRKQNRKLDFIKLISKKYFDIFNIPFNENINELKTNFFKVINKPILNDVLSLKLKGLKQELEKDELLKILYNYLSHRGFTYIDLEKYESLKSSNNYINENPNLHPFINFLESKIIERESVFKNKEIDENKIILKKIDLEISSEAEKYYDKNNKSFTSIANFISECKKYIKNKHYLNKFPSEIQAIQFMGNNKYRGDTINNDFSMHQWKEEIEAILKNQPYINQNFIDDYITKKNSIFLRLRDYSEGPGSEKSPSKYGLWRTQQNGEVKKISENLWDELIGHCSVYPNELRANKRSASSEIANFLSQLNMLLIKDENNRSEAKLLEKEKTQILETCLIKKKKPTLKLIASIINAQEKNIYHFPTNINIKEKANNENDKFEELTNCLKLIPIVSEIYKIKTFNDILENISLLNTLINIFSKYVSDVEKQKKEIRNLLNCNEEVVEKLILSKINAQSTSSMSEKALNEYISEEIKDGKEYGKTLNQRFKATIEKNQIDSLNLDVSNSNIINFKCFDNEIISPTTKCSFRETVKIFNAILKRYIYSNRNETKQKYFLKNVVMEMPTEWNSADNRKRIKDIQNSNESWKLFVKENYGYDGYDRKIITKLVLLHHQEGKDIYTKEEIVPSQIINDPNYCDIDHIIPYSVSYDDSLSNKVLVLNKTNKDKGKRTPFEFLGQGKFYNLVQWWKQLYSESEEHRDKKKFEKLTLMTIDDKRELGFIGRNLSDTRYACRLANNIFNTWIKLMKDNNKISLLSDDEVHVMNVNGKNTQWYARGKNYLNLGKKDREYHSHHAIDATICAILGNSEYDMGKLIWYRNIDHETGEVKTVSKYTYDSNRFEKDSDGETTNVGLNKFNNIKWKELTDHVANHPINYSYKMNKKSSFGFYGDSLISVKKIDKDKYIENVKINLLDLKTRDEVDKKIDIIKEKYFLDNKNLYPDPKLLEDILIVYEEGKKLSDIDEYKKNNPFKIYMDQYNKENNTNIQDRIMINRNNYVYSVKSIKIEKTINSFSLSKRKESENLIKGKKITAYCSNNWKEIRLFRNSQGNFTVIPMQISLYKNSYELDTEKYKNILEKENINIENIDNFICVHKGTCMISKTNKDIIKIVGITNNILEFKPIYKNLQKKERWLKSIDKILKEYDFINIDVLGNYWKRNLKI